MFKIAFDINGNDNGISAACDAAKTFLMENENFEIILVGPEEEIKKYYSLKKKPFPERLSIVNNPSLPSDTKNILQSVHENTSMNQAIDLVLNKKADAILSSGDSGTYLASTTFKMKRLPGIDRAAFMPQMPTIIGRKFLLLDVGANIETKVEYLVQWANIANTFAKVMLNNSSPRISLINIGTEDYKGTPMVQEANIILKHDPKINYVGFQEPRDILNGVCDVAVIDGYGGNLVLKSLEGAILSFRNLLKSRIVAKPIRKFGYLFLKGAFKEVMQTLDYRNVGAAWVVGIDGVAIKSHGSSDSKAYIGALNQIKMALQKDVLGEVKKALAAKQWAENME